MQHLSELGRLGLGSRMKRFSDYLISEVNTIYKQAGIEFEASCFPLLTLLHRYGPMTLRDAEQKLGTSHSYVSQKAKYLKEQMLVDINASKKDARNKHLSLTDKGFKLIEQVRPCWKDMDIAIARLLGDNEREIFQALTMLEDKIMSRSLSQQVRDLHSQEAENIQIADYDPVYKDAFASLNLEWLEKAFVLQDFDHKAFTDPEKNLIGKGGDVFFALANGKPIGTGALYPDGKDFELCKMGVDPRFRGKGIGELLVKTGMARAKKLGAKKLTLTSNTHKLAPAVRLYRHLGFQEVLLKKEDIEKYGKGRIDIRMEIQLS